MGDQLREDIREATKGGIPQYRLSREERIGLVGINDSLVSDIYESMVRDPFYMRSSQHDRRETYSTSRDRD